ncbi:hypothetical protein B0A50_03647 [Salinomyces thailandicus]|uniref:Uncharacterized protein n=1 Tax=Salinomyces thailandicus TaxID=706561 RepID=A0A4U0U2P7_9PEZI|nr:hypothetical protein B0A50_03647 [Salinomyces thailandica]
MSSPQEHETPKTPPTSSILSFLEQIASPPKSSLDSAVPVYNCIIMRTPIDDLCTPRICMAAAGTGEEWGRMV